MSEYKNELTLEKSQNSATLKAGFIQLSMPWHRGYSAERLTLGHQHAIISNEILKDKDQVWYPCILQSLTQSLANIQFSMCICSVLEEKMLRLQMQCQLSWWLWRELQLCTVCTCPDLPWPVSYPCLSFPISLSMQASLYQMGLEVATQPAALRTVTVCLSHLLSGLGGLWLCFTGRAHNRSLKNIWQSLG